MKNTKGICFSWHDTDLSLPIPTLMYILQYVKYYFLYIILLDLLYYIEIILAKQVRE